MFTKVIMSEDGDLVADSKVMEYAIENIGKTVMVGTDAMLTAFRVLRARGLIQDLEVVFCCGQIAKTDKHGSLEFWASGDPITSVFEDHALELVHWQSEGRKNKE